MIIAELDVDASAPRQGRVGEDEMTPEEVSGEGAGEQVRGLGQDEGRGSIVRFNAEVARHVALLGVVARDGIGGEGEEVKGNELEQLGGVFPGLEEGGAEERGLALQVRAGRLRVGAHEDAALRVSLVELLGAEARRAVG